VYERLDETLQPCYSLFEDWLLWLRHADVPSVVSQ
jgi:hypothetical protein